MTLNEYNLKRKQAFQHYQKRLEQIEKEQREAALAYRDACEQIDKVYFKTITKEITR